MNYEEGYVKVLEKAYTDSSYRARLIKNSNEAIKEVVGTAMPKGVNFIVHENTTTTQHYILPAPADAKAELSDVELEQVAGGKGLPSLPKLPCLIPWLVPILPKPPTFR
jgi:hypothetical protein